MHINTYFDNVLHKTIYLTEYGHFFENGRIIGRIILAEEVGFGPTRQDYRPNGFRDRPLEPLEYPSIC